MYTESQDLFNPNVLNLFDYESGLLIGVVTKTNGSYFAAVVGKNISATFHNLSCAKGFISSSIYGKKVIKRTKDKQLNLF